MVVGEGMGVLGCGANAAIKEDAGHDGGDEEGFETGVQVKKMARIVQRLVGMARAGNGHWARHVEWELRGGWPGMKEYWKK